MLYRRRALTGINPKTAGLADVSYALCLCGQSCTLRAIFSLTYGVRMLTTFSRGVVNTALILGAVFLSGCASLQQIMDVQKPTASVAGVSLGNISLSEATLLVDVAVANPNGFALDAAGFDLDLAIAGQSLAKVAQPDSQVKVPAQGTGKVQLPVTLNFNDVAKALGGFGDNNQVDYAIDGNVTMNVPVLGDISLPLSFADVLPIPQLPKISFSDVSLSDVSWSGAKMLVNLDVTNPNSFGVNLNSLAYNLQAQGKALGSGALSGIKLEEGQTQNIAIPLDISLTNLGISLFRMLSGGDPVEVGLSGKADVAPDLGLWKPEPMEFNASRTLNP